MKYVMKDPLRNRLIHQRHLLNKDIQVWGLSSIETGNIILHSKLNNVFLN